jgi:hypothetical protein
MAPDTGRTAPYRRRAATSAFAATTLILSSSLLFGCSVVSGVRNVANNVMANKNTIDAFTSTMKAGTATAFKVTYATTGASPAVIMYAVRPPNELLFVDSSSGVGTGTGGIDLITNASGEFSCSPAPTSSSAAKKTRTCTRLGTAQAAVQNQLVNLYTPSHWVAFLQGLSLAAGFAGDKITQSRLTVNGFDMKCVDFQASGIPGTSTICTTAQGILGYVKVATDTTSFEITSYSASPSASLFELPRGAKVTAA